MTKLNAPILVIAYNDDSRAALAKTLGNTGVEYLPASTFAEAEDIAVSGLFNGILVDLSSMIKAKGEEKIIACSLAGFFPTLRVRTMGSMVIPMSMPGEAKQDSSLNDFINKSCMAFAPRKLRASKRKDIVLSTIVTIDAVEYRGFTTNISWGGVFIADVEPEKYQVNQILSVRFHEVETELKMLVRWVQPFGFQKKPGIGLAFTELDDVMNSALLQLLKHSADHCRDRMVA